METRIFGRLTAWQNWIFIRPNAVGEKGALKVYGTGEQGRSSTGSASERFDEQGASMSSIDYSEKIPNNVNLAEDRTLQRALEHWQPNSIDWWDDMGPDGSQDFDVYLRTAISVDPQGWAHFDYVKMPDYRWGIFLQPGRRRTARSTSATTRARPPGRTCPASTAPTCAASSSRRATPSPPRSSSSATSGLTAPSLYDLRNLFQVNVEEGRHLWAMVYLLHRYFGRDGREEAEALLERRSGDADNPRILGAFNEQTPDWLAFFMFTYFTDRDGKFQLCALAESGFDPLARTTQVHADRGSAPHVRRRVGRRARHRSAPAR